MKFRATSSSLSVPLQIRFSREQYFDHEQVIQAAYLWRCYSRTHSIFDRSSRWWNEGVMVGSTGIW